MKAIFIIHFLAGVNVAIHLKKIQISILNLAGIQRHIPVNCALTLWWQLLPYGHSYKVSCARPG